MLLMPDSHCPHQQGSQGQQLACAGISYAVHPNRQGTAAHCRRHPYLIFSRQAAPSVLLALQPCWHCISTAQHATWALYSSCPILCCCASSHGEGIACLWQEVLLPAIWPSCLLCHQIIPHKASSGSRWQKWNTDLLHCLICTRTVGACSAAACSPSQYLID
jgi:hypothetical protein